MTNHCTPKDSDTCLTTSPGWGSYVCSNADGYCDSWSKDVRRCCPESCKNTMAFTESICNDSNGKGHCTYPNDAQCPEGNSLMTSNVMELNLGIIFDIPM